MRGLGITGGVSAGLGDLEQAAASEVLDCRGPRVPPGVIGTRWHPRSKEDPETRLQER